MANGTGILSSDQHERACEREREEITDHYGVFERSGGVFFSLLLLLLLQSVQFYFTGTLADTP